MDISLPIIAGTVSTVFFLSAEVPMLSKAFRTKELASYSIGNIAIANAGNVVHSLYVYALPPGPIWVLHTFYMVSTALMLLWYLRFEGRPRISIRHDRRPARQSRPALRTVSELPHPNTPSGG